MSDFVLLPTDFETDLKNSTIPFSDYPRPQLKRDSYLCLNGEWDFSIENRGPQHSLFNTGKAMKSLREGSFSHVT